MKILRKTCCAFTLLVMMGLFFGCGVDNEESVRIGLLNIDDSLPFFVAEAEGLYEDYGVKVELLPFGSAREKELALEAGEIDGDMTDLVVTGLLKKGGLELRIVETALGVLPSEGRFALLAAPNSGITAISELRGKKIAIGDNTIIQYVCDRICSLNGFSESELVTENIPDLSLRLESLLSGAVPAAVLPDPLAAAAIKEGAQLLADDTKLNDENGTPLNLSQSVVLFRTESIEQKGEAISLAMQAYDEAKNKITNDPEAYRGALSEFTAIPSELAAVYPMPSYTAAELPTSSELNAVFNWMVEKGLLDHTYNYDEMVYAMN